MGKEEYDFEKLDSYSEDEQQKAIDLQEQYIDSLEEAMKSNSNYSEEPQELLKNNSPKTPSRKLGVFCWCEMIETH